MKNIKIFSIILAVLMVVLTPAVSSAQKAKNPKSAKPASAAAVKGPKIPIPTGDVRKAAPQPGAAPKIQIGKAETFTLDNGLKVIVVENHKLPRVSYRVFSDYDPILEKDAIGYVDMMGQLLSKGTTTRTKAQIDEAVDFVGASLFSSSNGVSASCLTKHADKLLAIMSDVLLNPTFPEAELTKAKRQAESGLASAKDDPNTIASNVASIVRYGKNHPYGEVMTEATLAKVNLDNIKAHYNAVLKPNISYLVITGDITKAVAQKQAQQYFGKWQRGTVAKQNYAMPKAPEKTQVDFVHKPGAVQSVINITYPVELVPGTPDVIRGRVMNALLGGYFNSRLNSNLREGKGWTYGAGSSLNSDKLVGSFNAGASVRNAVTDSAIIEFVKEMNILRTQKPSVEELTVVKNVIAGQFSRSLEEPGTVAEFALNTARYGLPADYYEKYLEVLSSVTPEDVMAMAQKYIRTDRAHIVVVGNKDDVADRLKQFAADGKVNFYDAFGEPVKPATAAMPDGMTAEKVIEDYINAIGGQAKISALKDMMTTMGMSMQGMEITMKTYQKGGNKIVIETLMGGNVMQKQFFDGEKGGMSAMGQKQDLDEKMTADLKKQASFCPECNYKSSGYQLMLKGLEEVNGAPAYVVSVLAPGKDKPDTEYYDMKTSLKIREITEGQDMNGQAATTIVDYSDYKDAGGVLRANTIVLTGIMPIPMKMTVKEIKVNSGIDDGVFKN
jgi:zinc protease